MPLPYYVSPEQMMQDKAEYAKKGIAKGRSIIALEYIDGILLAADNPSSSLHKVSEVYDRIAFAGAGKYSEFEHLRKAGIRHADLTGYMYSREDVSARTLSNAYSQSLGTAFSTDVRSRSAIFAGTCDTAATHVEGWAPALPCRPGAGRHSKDPFRKS